MKEEREAWENAWHLCSLNGGWFITGAELRRYGKPHTSLLQGRERAEHPCGWQRCGAGELPSHTCRSP
jgi:hypothetical protein